MKKASFTNLSIIIGLLILCVVVLLAVYATAPESVMLLEESFDLLDEGKWRHEKSECTEGGQEFRYVADGVNDSITANGFLHIYPNLTNLQLRSKRDAPNKCYSCITLENSTSDCIPSLLSARLQSKTSLNASRGRLEIRAKLCCGDQIRFHIGLLSNLSQSVEASGNVELGNDGSENGSGGFYIFFGSAGNATSIKSPINDSEFHVYQIDWDSEQISLNIDNKRVIEDKLEMVGFQEEYFSNTTAKLDSAPISKPFYLSMGVDFGGKLLDYSGNHSDSKRSVKGEEEVEGVQVDYVRVFRILN